MVLHILTPYRIEAYDGSLKAHLVDDLVHTIQSIKTKIATDQESLRMLIRQYPDYYIYSLDITKVNKSNVI